MPDTRVRDQLTRGARIRAILDQPQHEPLRLADEVALVLAVQSGLLDPLPLAAVVGFRRGLREALDRDAAAAVRAMQETGGLNEALKATLVEAMRRYAGTMTPPAAPATAPAR
jgi:F-type H+-transporting ATPase subunit alpha